MTDSLRWFRCYPEILRDPKVMTMDEVMRWRLIGLMALRADGQYPAPDGDVAFGLRISLEQAQETLALFRDRGFLLENGDFRNWEKRQYKSDSSTERVRKHRETFQKRSGNGLEQSRADQTSEQNINKEAQKRLREEARRIAGGQRF